MRNKTRIFSAHNCEMSTQMCFITNNIQHKYKNGV